MKPQQIIKKYPKSMTGYASRKRQEFFLFRQGYIVFSEETVKNYSGGKGLLLGLIFLPLALLGGRKYTQVTYTREV